MLAPLAAAAALLLAPSPSDPVTVYSGRAGETTITVPRVDADVEIDGALDEPAWRQAAVLTGFSQYAPLDGRAADDSTEVLVWYSATAIHFGIRAFEKHGTVNATLADRDRITGDDYIELLLGTFNDGRQATVLGVNPLGVQADGMLVETGTISGGSFNGATAVRERPDLSPDFVYQSKGRLTPDGYQVEIRVPFKSLRYRAGDEQRWSLNVIRYVQHSGFEDVWAPAERAASSFLRQSGTLAGLRDLHRGLVLDVTPEVTASATGAPAADGWSYDERDAELGANVRWGITNNLTMNGTVNPDFSQVEADAGQFTFDPRQALFFSEKRPFFLDGIEQFATPNNLIYSRRIVQPVAAAKLTGKVSGTDVGVLSAVDDRGVSATGEHPIYNILRLQRDVGAGSRLGFAYTDRVEGSSANRVASLDSRLVLGKVTNAQLQVAGSRTTAGGVTKTAPLWRARLQRNGRTLGLRYQINAIHEDFRAQSGFISRPGIVNATLSHSLTRYGAQGALLENVNFEGLVDGTWYYRDFTDGHNPQDRKMHLNLNAAMRGGWAAGASVLIESFGYDEELYDGYFVEAPAAGGGLDTLAFTGTPRLGNLDYLVQLATPQWSRFSGSVFYLWGRDENFFEWSSSDIIYATITANWRPTDRLRITGQYQHQHFDRVTDGSTVGVRKIPRLKVEYQVARPLFVRLVGEYDASRQDDLRDDSRTEGRLLVYDPAAQSYAPLLARSANRFRGDVLLSYQPIPGTVVFVGYGSTSVEPDELRFRRLRRTTDGFFVKASYLFRM